jgi:SAM-dependent methyltransferase
MILSPLADKRCQICSAASLREIESFRALERVTSDAKTWEPGGRLCVCGDCGTGQKVVDADWLGEIEEVYRRYALYYQSSGDEQPIFSSRAGGPVPRSALIADYLESVISLGNQASVLDFGCGNGSALRTFSKRRPMWRLYGAELSDSALERLRQLPNFVTLFTGRPEDIAERFDLVTLIHALEHVVEPASVLSAIRRLLVEGGHTFVAVPNGAITPYDLVIADHLTHFSLDALRRVGVRAGYDAVAASDSILPKELSWIGVASSGAVAPPAMDAGAGVRRIQAQVAWLHEQIASADRIARAAKSFGVFGTSISGTWLAGALGESVHFFVDEDPGRMGRQHMGRPIVSPGQIRDGSDVYVPLIPSISNAVAGRCERPGVRFHATPDIGR